MDKVVWGVLSTAKIAVQRVIPAMQKGDFSEIRAIASRDAKKSRMVADELSVPVSYGSYEELLADPEIQAVYNPLPNHLHIPWTIKAIESGKHVLCEKPLAMNVEEAKRLVEFTCQYPEIKVMEAFMYRFHPQWRETRNLVHNKSIGDLRTIQSVFSYHNINPDNIRNIPEAGGGGLMDIGCYSVSLSRFLFGKEPERVVGLMEFDDKLGIDRLTSGLLDFGTGTSTFTCSTQIMPFQRVQILGTNGRIEIEIPFNAPNDKAARLWFEDASGLKEITFKPTDQFTIQGDEFSQSILYNNPVPTPLEDAVNNMRVIDAVINSSKNEEWITL